jgi:endonuclease I
LAPSSARLWTATGTCESGCNSFRGNIPYGDFPDFEEAVRDDCGKREEGRFEPSLGKGAVARATLYFFVRYPGTIDGRYDARRLRIPLSWHAAKPMDEWERHRNAVASELQGNRNPFIDFPDLAVKLF